MFIYVGEDDVFLTGSTSKKTKSPAQVSEPAPQPSTGGTLSPDSDDLFKDDNLFGSGANKKPASAPAKTAKQESPAVAKRPQRSDDLFTSSPEPGKRDDDSDDLFSSKPSSNKPSPQISKATKEPASSSKATPPLSKKEASPKIATKKKSPTGGLFGGSDESDDDLFAAPKPKKSAQPKPASKSTKAPVSDDLFSDEPFGVSTKSQSKAKPATKQAPPSDDLFTDPLATSPPPPDTKPKSTKKAAKPVVEDTDDDLFSDPLGGNLQPTSSTKSKAVKPSGDDLFSDDPLASKSLPPQVDATRSKSKPKAKASDDLFDDPLSTSPPPDTRPKPKSKPASDDLFDDPLASSPPPKTKPKPSRTESDGLFSDEPSSPKVEEVPAKRKKPAGAVSLFGGVDPFAAAGKSKVGKSHDQEKPRLSTSPEKKDSLFGKKNGVLLYSCVISTCTCTCTCIVRPPV